MKNKCNTTKDVITSATWQIFKQQQLQQYVICLGNSIVPWICLRIWVGIIASISMFTVKVCVRLCCEFTNTWIVLT